MKAAAEASGRKIAFVGTSLFTYLEAAWRDGRAPFDPRTVIQPGEIDGYDPNELLIITTGSQVGFAPAFVSVFVSVFAPAFLSALSFCSLVRKEGTAPTSC